MTNRDEELALLLSMNDSVLDELADSDGYGYVDQDHEVREAQYMDDLRAVLSIPNGAGLRVLRWWIDAAGGNSRAFVTNSNIYRNAALADYSKDRTAEICAADPRAFLRLILEGAREWKREEVKSEKESKR